MIFTSPIIAVLSFWCTIASGSPVPQTPAPKHAVPTSAATAPFWSKDPINPLPANPPPDVVFPPTIPTPTAINLVQPRDDHHILARQNQPSRLSSLPYSLSTIPNSFPTTISASSTFVSSYTTGTRVVDGWINLSLLGELTTSITETQIEPFPTRPTSFPYTATGSVIGTTTTIISAWYFNPWASIVPYIPCSTITGGTTTEFPTCVSFTPPPLSTPSPTSSLFTTSYETNTWTWKKIWHFSLTEFPTTVTSIYTSSKTSLVTTTHLWDFGGGPRPPLPTTVSTTAAAYTPLVEVYNVTYIDVATVVEEWKSKPTSLPYTLTQTAEVTHSEIITFTEDGLTMTAIKSETTYPTLVVGEIKELPLKGNYTFEFI